MIHDRSSIRLDIAQPCLASIEVSRGPHDDRVCPRIASTSEIVGKTLRSVTVLILLLDAWRRSTNRSI